MVAFCAGLPVGGLPVARGQGREETAEGLPTVAIVAEADERLQAMAELVTVALSKSGEAALVERADLKKIRAEQELQASFAPGGVASRRNLGALLRADFLVLLRKRSVDGSSVLDIVIAETRHGYRVARHMRKWKGVTIGSAGEEIVSVTRDALRHLSRGVAAAVAIPPFYSRNLTHHFDYLQRAYARVAEMEVTRRPGCVVVEIEEARAIAEELALSKGADRVGRRPPVYIMGEFRHEGAKPDAVVGLSLRLEKKDGVVMTESDAGLPPAAAAAFVRAATDRMMRALLKAQGEGLPPRQAGAEERRLAASGRAFMEIGAFDEAGPLYEAALLINPDNAEARQALVDTTIRIAKLPPDRRQAATLQERAYLALRGCRHLAWLARNRKYVSFRKLRANVTGLLKAPGVVSGLVQDCRQAGMEEESEMLVQAGRDFFLHDFPRTWHEKGWPDYGQNSNRYWAELILTCDLGRMSPEPGREDFEYRLRLVRRVLLSKPETLDRAASFVMWRFLESPLLKEKDPESLAELERVYNPFLQQLRDDKEPFFQLLEQYIRFVWECRTSWTRRDIVAFAEMEMFARKVKDAGLPDRAEYFEDHLMRFRAGEYDRLNLANTCKYPHMHLKEKVVRRPRAEEDTERLQYEEVEIRYVGKADKDGGHPVSVRRLVKCSEGVDVLWWSSAIAVMTTRGKAEEIFADRETTITDVRWDGKWLWAGTKQGRILLIDPVEATVRSIGADEGVPESGMGMVVCPLETGRACVIGALPPHGRAWCANVTEDGSVDVFHEARTLGVEREAAGADKAFAPCWTYGIRSRDGAKIERILVGRESQENNKYSLIMCPLVVDPYARTAAPLGDTLRLGSSVTGMANIARVGEFLFIGRVAYKLPEFTYRIQMRECSGRFVWIGGKLYSAGELWLEIDPKTLEFEILRSPVNLSSDAPHVNSWHYGVLAGDRDRSYAVSVREKAADTTKQTPDPTVVRSAPDDPGVTPTRKPKQQEPVSVQRGVPLPMAGLLRAENLLSRQITEQPQREPLYAAPGDVIELMTTARHTWTYVCTGKESGLLRFSQEHGDDGRMLLVDTSEGKQVVGISTVNLFDLDELAAFCARHPDVPFVRINNPFYKGLTSLAPLQNLRNLRALTLQQGKEVIGLQALAEIDTLVALKISHWKHLADLDPLADLENLRVLDLYGCDKIGKAGRLGEMVNLERLVVTGRGFNSDNLATLSGLDGLTYLRLGTCGWDDELAPLAGLANLRLLSIGEGRNVTTLAPLAGLTNLEDLHINGGQVGLSLAPLAGMKKLRKLAIATYVTDLETVRELPSLKELSLGGCDGLEPLAGVTTLTKLRLSKCGTARGLEPLAGLKNLEALSLRLPFWLEDLGGLAGLTNLTYLSIQNADRLKDLSPLSGLTKLTFLNLAYCRALSDLGPLSSLTNLRQLVLEDCVMISEIGGYPGLKPLANMKKLERLGMENCGRISDLTPLAGLPKLRHLYMIRCNNVISLTQLGRMPSLRDIYIPKGDRLTEEEIAAFKKINRGCKINRW